MRLQRTSRASGSVILAVVALGAGCSASPNHELAPVATGKRSHATPNDAANLAYAQRYKGPCDTNTLGGSGFENSCSGEAWCADFAMWVWDASGFNVCGLTASAGSFYTYGQQNGTLHDSPQVGDAIVYNYIASRSPPADHVELVTSIDADGTVHGVSGNGGGNVVSPDTTCGQDGWCQGYGNTISGFISPVTSPGCNQVWNGTDPSAPPSGGGGNPPPPSGSSGGGGGGGGGGSTDACANVPDGGYCGNDPSGPGGDPNTLFWCMGGVTTSSTPCGNGCTINPGQQDDSCNQAATPPPPPPSGGGDACANVPDGGYCGNDPDGPGGDPNTLYWCMGGVTTSTTPCANGCTINPGQQDDSCN